MHIDENLISYLEDLSYLSFVDDEKQRLTDDLQKILDGMALLGGLNTENASERCHPFDHVNAFRDDRVQESFDRRLILQNAPDRNDEMFIAPKTVET